MPGSSGWRVVKATNLGPQRATYRLSRHALQDLPGTLAVWASAQDHIQNWGGSIVAVVVDGRPLTLGQIRIVTSMNLTLEQQAHIGVIAV